MTWGKSPEMAGPIWKAVQPVVDGHLDSVELGDVGEAFGGADVDELPAKRLLPGWRR
jgi:hypothetical protein